MSKLKRKPFCRRSRTRLCADEVKELQTNKSFTLMNVLNYIDLNEEMDLIGSKMTQISTSTVNYHTSIVLNHWSCINAVWLAQYKLFIYSLTWVNPDQPARDFISLCRSMFFFPICRVSKALTTGSDGRLAAFVYMQRGTAAVVWFLDHSSSQIFIYKTSRSLLQSYNKCLLTRLLLVALQTCVQEVNPVVPHPPVNIIMCSFWSKSIKLDMKQYIKPKLWSALITF